MDEGTRYCGFISLSVLFSWLCLQFHVSAGADTISANQTLSGDQTIVSAGGEFKLGFFSPGNSSNFYIGMWYARVREQTIVWVANREKPVTDKNSSVLKISDGNLVLLDKSQVLIWSTNVSSAVRGDSLQAVLRNDGNLVLINGIDSSSSTPLWQSFDFPTDTWLPGVKIRLNKRTGESQRLTSWKNSEDPSPGLFSLEVDPKEGNSYIILWNQSKTFWSSGPWNGQIFSGVPEMRLNYLYDFSFENDTNESYFTYSLYNDSIISRFTMDVSGQIKQRTWLENIQQWNLFWSQPRQQCEVYAYCGPFGSCDERSSPFCQCMEGFEHASQQHWDLKDYSGGCKRKTDIECSNISVPNGKSDKFASNPNMKLAENPQSTAAGSIQACESACLANCSCTAYAFENSQCSIWNGNLLNLQQLSDDNSEGKTLYLRLAASEVTTENSHNSKNNNLVVIAAVLSSLGVLACGFLLFVFLSRRKRGMKIAKAAEGSLLPFGYRELQSATKNFSQRLGGGGFGSVYKGILPDSSEVAVKKLESISQGEKQFRTEVGTIGTIQHVNLVRLRGFCSEGTKKLLVYDYMANGSLDSHLFNQTVHKILDWKTRYQIAVGTARGLSYLHEECRACIIHCDIKPENILLDSQLGPKVADFGLAKLMGRDFSRVLTTMRGTRGYLAPEWISGVAITAKADVYSYGMMVFEIVSGRRNNEQSQDGTKVEFFPTRAASVLTQGGDITSVIDPRLERNDVDAEEVLRLCKVACWCIQDEEDHRPSMGQVVQILEGVLDVNMPPLPRSIKLFVENQENIVFYTESSTSQSSGVPSQISTSSSLAKSSSSTSGKS